MRPSSPSLTRRLRTSQGGFTLIEILMSMMFLSLGIMGVIAFFFLGASSGREASRTTRATMMAREIREGLVYALRYPLPATDVPGADTPLFRFELPSLVESTSGGLNISQPTVYTDQLLDEIDGFYFFIESDPADLPTNEFILENYNDTTKTLDERILDLPYEAIGDPVNPPTHCRPTPGPCETA